MLCHCSTNILRSFIRTVAQVELPTSTRQASRRCFQSSSFVHASPTFRGQLSISQRQITTTSCLRSVSADFAQPEPAESRKQGDNGQELSSTDPVEPADVQVENGSAFVDFSLEALDDILADSQGEDIHNVPEIDRVIEDDTPEGFVAGAFEKHREQRERKGKDTAWRSLDFSSNAISTSPQVSRNKLQPSTRPAAFEEQDPTQYSTFPRLPRIARDTIMAAPLKSRTKETFKPKPQSKDWRPPERERWQIEKEAIKAKYPSGYAPQKRLSPDAITGIRALHAQMPEEYHTRKLAETFQVSPEAISRILRTNWTPNADEEEDRARRWLKRGEAVWTRYAEMGVKPPKRWREAGIGNDSELGKAARERRKEKKRLGGPNVPPVLVTLPKRPGGLYKLGGKKRTSGGDDGAGFI